MRHGTFLALGLWTVVLLAGQPALVTGRAVPLWDAATFYSPYYSLVADHARAGRLLLWNPWTNGGSPDCAEPQVGAFSPLTIGFAALTGPGTGGFTVYWLALWWLAGAGMMVLARRLGVSPLLAVIPALALGTGGFLTGHAEHTSFVVSMAFLPWLLWRVETAAATGRLRPAVEAGALWGLGGLAGYPALTLLHGAVAGLWLVARSRFPPRIPGPVAPGPRLRLVALSRALGLGAVMLVVGLAVLAPPFAAFRAEARGFSDRSEPLDRGVATGSNTLLPGSLATAASPALVVVKAEQRELWGQTDPSMVGLYLGTLVPVLALGTLVLGRGGRFRWVLAAGVLLALGLAVGHALPLRGWLYDLFPPTRYFRHPALFRGYAQVFLALLALPLLRDLPRRLDDRRWLRRLALLATAGAVTAQLAVAAVLLAAGPLSLRARTGLVLSAGVWAASALLWWGAVRYPAVARRLPALLALFAAADGAHALFLSSPLIATEARPAIEAVRAAEAAHDPRLDLTSRGLARELRHVDGAGDRNNRNLLPKIPVLDGYAPFSSRYHEHLLRSPALVAGAVAADRIWFGTAPLWAPPTVHNLRVLVRRTERLGGQPPLLLHHREEMLGDAAAVGPGERLRGRMPPLRPALATVERYQPNELVLRVSAPADGWLLMTDRFARGWRAWVDGAETPVLPANLVFRAVQVRRGAHTVTFRYRPWGYPWLVVLSWGTLAAVAAGSAGVMWRNRRRRPGPAPGPTPGSPPP
jgi:hypothetical protein